MANLGLWANQKAVRTNAAQGHVGLGTGGLLDAVNDQHQFGGYERTTIWARPNPRTLGQKVDLFAADHAVKLGGRAITQGNGDIRCAGALKRLIEAIG